jgi:hypothetical protein
MTKQEFRDFYGKSVYQLRLELILSFFNSNHNLRDCLKFADDFVASLLNEDAEKVKNLYVKTD